MLSTVLAQIDLSAPGQFSTLGGITVATIVSALITLVLIIAALVFFFMLIIGGIKWITSGGDKAAMEMARGRVISAIVGIVILFSTWAILQLIEGFFNINILTLDILNLAIQ